MVRAHYNRERKSVSGQKSFVFGSEILVFFTQIYMKKRIKKSSLLHNIFFIFSNFRKKKREIDGTRFS